MYMIRNNLTIINFCFCLILICIKVNAKKLYIFPRDVGICNENGNNKHVSYSNFKLNKYGKQVFTLDIEMDLKHSFPAVTDGFIHVTRCNSYTDESSCEFYTNITMDKLSCGMINMKNQIWSDFIHKYEPPLRCPFKKGTYTAKNITVDVEKMSQWASGLENYFWKGYFILKDSKTKEELMCNHATADVLRAS